MENIYMPFITSTIIALFMTPIAKKIAIRFGAVDIPKDERRVHNKPMPLMGGLAIYIGILISSLIFLPKDNTLISIILGGTVIFISGVIDDIKGLSPKAKLVFQIIASIILIFGDVKIDTITNPCGSLILLKVSSIPITILGSWNYQYLNLIDGLDGLAAGWL